jgi:hypothetical protein
VKRTCSFVAITTEGGLLPADFLVELLSPKADIDGLTPTSYNLAEGERIGEQVNRSWNRLKGRWADFKSAIAEKSADEFTTTETRNRWLQPLFQELGYGQRLTRAKPIEIDGKSYPVSHAWNHVPMHFVGAHIDLDHRTPGAVGAAKASPHSMVQQLLNASDEHLWGIVSNGLTLRLLRDNIALTRQALVEWDLAAIFDGDLYSEFFVLWLVLHQSRFDAEHPEQCWIEKWKKKSEDKGLRALDRLRLSVAQSIEALGKGLVSHPANKALRFKLSNGELTTQDFYRQILRLIYRLIFLLVAEERELLHLPLPTHEDKDIVDRAIRARQRYHDFYSVGRLRKLTLARAGTPHSDLWQTFQIVGAKLGSNLSCPELGLNALGSFLWDAARSTPDLNEVLLSNYQFITAVHALTFVQDGSIRRFVDYKNLGSEELGSVYEGLLELHPTINTDAGTFELEAVAGNERKMSGSYYTPDSLVQCLLDSALEPVIAEAIKGKQGEAAVKALLNLKICDPAAGSGHFLIAAAHRLAKHVAAARSGEDEPGPTRIRTALRDVIGICIYGIDINPMAVELCKVSLWMEAVEPGKPLSFLDHHIQCGNSLFGATPARINEGIPDDAFKSIEGDDPKLCSEYRKQNKRERQQKTLLGFHGEPWEYFQNLATSIVQIARLPDECLEDVHAKEEQYTEFIHSTGYKFGRQLADAWCAAFVWKKCASTASGFEYPITDEVFHRLERSAADVPNWMHNEINRLAAQYQFFHWYLAFPDVFQVPTSIQKPENELSGCNGGFDVILGNPPWEQAELEETEWFAVRRPEITLAPNDSERKKMIAALKLEAPELYQAFINARREYDAVTHYARRSGLYPFCGQGRINTASLFAELSRNLCHSSGRIGFIVPTGIATDDTTKEFFNDLIRNQQLISLFGFHNGKRLFPSVRPHQHFCLLTLGENRTVAADFAFSLSEVWELNDPNRRFSLTRSDIELVNPNTQTCPIFPTKRHMVLMKTLYQRVPILIREADKPDNPWGISFKQGLFNMATDSGLFRTKKELEADGWAFDETRRIFARDGEEYIPLYDAKMIQQYNHRAADLGFSGHQFRKISKERTSLEQLIDPSFSPSPIYWVSKCAVTTTLQSWTPRWLLAFKDVTGTTSTSIGVFTIIPISGVGHKLPLILSTAKPNLQALLLANLNSLVTEYVLRLKFQGLSLSFYYVKQLPVLPPQVYSNACAWAGQAQTLESWLLPRVLELTYTAWDLEPFAQDCGWSGPPFQWNEERRFLLLCELNAAFFYLYGLSQEDIAYILDAFPILRRKDEERFNGDYRTKRVILEIYDEMVSAVTKGLSYYTRLNPPPTYISVTHLQPYLSLPLMLPQGFRFSQADQNVYAMRIILSMLTLSGNRMEISTLMTACGLLARPERLRTFARDVNPDIVVAWSRSFSDTFDPNLFLPTIDELVRRGELNLEREGQKFMVNRVGTMHIVTDPYIEFDALLALQVEGSLTEAERQSILPMASSQELEVRFKVA